MVCEMDSLSERISARFLVPSTFRSVVAARRRVEWLRKQEWCKNDEFYILRI